MTYYWCAAIQRGAKPLEDATFGPSITAAMFLTFGVVLIITAWAAHGAYLYGSPKIGSFWTLLAEFPMTLIIIVLGFAGFMLVNLFQYGFPSAIGSMIIGADRLKSGRSSYLTIVRVMGAVIVIQALTVFALFGLVNVIFGFSGLTVSDQSFYESLWFLVGAVFWGLGLVIARFPKVLERGRKPLASGAVIEKS